MTGDWWLVASGWWLGIRDWGLGVTGILRHRHPERSRGIFTALRESACMCRGKTMSWCCLTCDDERSAIKTLGYARNDDAREALSKLRGASLFLCAAPPFRISHFSFNRGFHPPSRGSTPPRLTLNHEPKNEPPFACKRGLVFFTMSVPYRRPSACLFPASGRQS